MKAHLSVFALSAILIASIGMAPAFGQSSIVVTTDKASYSEGDTILITGEVTRLLGGFGLTVTVTSDLGNRVFIDQLTVGADKKFSTSMSAGGSLMKNEGTYTVSVQYGDNKINSATTSFEFGGSTPPSGEDGSRVTDTTVSVEGSSDLIRYEITCGKLISIMPDLPVDPEDEYGALMININAIKDCSLTLTNPRSVLD